MSTSSDPNNPPSSSTIDNTGDDNKIPENALPAELPNTTSGKKYFEQLFEKMSDDYLNRTIELAKKNEYMITLRIPSGEFMPDPTDPNKQIKLFKDEVPQARPFTRKKVSVQDYKKIEILRAQFNRERDPEKVIDKLITLYQYMAYYFLGMKLDEFDCADWDEIKPVLDACNFRTVYSLPNSVQG